MRLKNVLILSLMNFSYFTSSGQLNFWKSASIPDTEIAGRTIYPGRYSVFELDFTKIEALLHADNQFRTGKSIELYLPDPEGNMVLFKLKDSPIMESELAAKYSDIKTFTLQGDKYTGRGDITEFGFHAMLISGESTIFIDPLSQGNKNLYQVYYKSDFSRGAEHTFSCEVEQPAHELPTVENNLNDPSIKSLMMGQRRSAPVNLRTYRLALACTGEYAQFHGGTVSAVMAQMVIAINRVNTVYENDLAIRLIIINGNDALIYLDGDTDPYSNNNGNTMLGQNQTTVNGTIGAANYDIGHVFSTGGGGIAQLQSVCGGGKARGVTGLGSPTGDPFYIDYVCHEVGHQFGGNHTFNNCSGNENSSTAFEPGSGSTIMAYAGICGATNNVQFRSDDYFHVGSLEEIFTFSRFAGGNGCATIIPTENVDPVINILSPSGIFIPVSTPFELAATATDDTSQTLQFTWEQYDTGPTSPMGNPTGNAPLFRSIKPTTSGVRTFPALTNILNGTSTTREVLPTTSRPLNFKCTVRDFASGGGGAHWAEQSMRSTADAGPFKVLNPLAQDTILAGSIYQLAWDVAGTDQEPVNCAFVDILFSKNGGQTFTDTLAKNIPNNGTAFVLMPLESTNQARIKVKAAGNVFFQVNPGNFRIVQPTIPGFSFAAGSTSGLTCVPNNITIPLETVSLVGYDQPIQLEIINASVQNDISFNFLDNPMIPGTNSSLEVNIGPLTGMITFEIMATGPDADTVIVPVQLNTQLGLTGAVDLVFPEAGSSNVSTIPYFEWQSLDQALLYQLEISTNPDFLDPEHLIITPDIIAELSTLLAQNTLYFWRVRALNECSSTEYSQIRAFYTSIVNCSTYSKTDDIAISGSGTPTINSQMIIADDTELTDVFIPNVTGNHQWFSDLEFSLIAPDGSENILVQRKCGNSSGTFNFGFSDESLSEFACPPNQNIVNLPLESFSRFKGKRSAGTWNLRVKDTRGTSGGRLLGWTLGLCGPVTLSQPDLIRNELLELRTGTERDITNDFLLVQDPVEPATSISYILVSLPVHGSLLLDGVLQQVGAEFTQEQINSRSLVYVHLTDMEEDDSFDFVVVNGKGGWIDINTFHIQTSDDFVSSVHPVNLDGLFKIYPNPASETIHIVAEGELYFKEIQIVNQLGQVISNSKLSHATLQQSMDVRNLPSGSYFVKILGDQILTTKPIVIFR